MLPNPFKHIKTKPRLCNKCIHAFPNLYQHNLTELNQLKSKQTHPSIKKTFQLLRLFRDMSENFYLIDCMRTIFHSDFKIIFISKHFVENTPTVRWLQVHSSYLNPAALLQPLPTMFIQARQSSPHVHILIHRQAKADPQASLQLHQIIFFLAGNSERLKLTKEGATQCNSCHNIEPQLLHLSY